MPNFLYAGERVLLVIDAELGAATNVVLSVRSSLDNAQGLLPVAPLPATQPVSSGMNIGTVRVSVGRAVLPVCIDSPPEHPRELAVEIRDPSGAPLAVERFLLSPLASMGGAVRVEQSTYRDETGRRVIWVSTLDPWVVRRKWWLPRKMARWEARFTEPVLWLGAPAASLAGDASTVPFPNRLEGLRIGCEVRSLLDLPLVLQQSPALLDGGRNILISLPPEDIRNRLSFEDVVRAIDAVTRLMRLHLGSDCSIALLTPFPLPGQEALSEHYAAAIREAGRHANLPVVDLHAAFLALPDWERFYSADGVAFCESPLQHGQDQAAAQLAKAFLRLHLREHAGDSSVSRQVREADGSRGPPSSSVTNSSATNEGRSAATPNKACGALRPRAQGQVAHPTTLDQTVCTNDGGRTSLRAVGSEKPASLSCRFPGSAMQWDLPSIAGKGATTLKLDVALPADAPAGISPTLCLKDKDGLWFQTTAETPLAPGRTNHVTFAVDAAAPGMRPQGHAACWGDYYRRKTVVAGLGLFSGSSWTGRVVIANAQVLSAPSDLRPLRLLHFQAPAPDAVCTGRFDVAFTLDGGADLNPFDPAQISVVATFEAPSGRRIDVDGFFYQSFTRALVDGKERITPSGSPGWRVRFMPVESGSYRYTLRVVTLRGSIASAPRAFDSRPSSKTGFVHVSTRDPRFFECADGTPFYPLGLNIHAPFDARCAEMLRRPVPPNRGTFAYDDYFDRLAAAGANACVVWCAPWWLEFEWTRDWPGFGGLADFNLGNAWRLDHLLESAERHGIRLHLVLENHGKYSLWVDEQWRYNPYNRINGGMLSRPEEFFESPAVAEAYHRKLRYLVSRWASSPALLGVELVGEMNLIGSDPKFRGNPAEARWVAATAGFLHRIDPYGHPLAVHYSNDWRTVDPAVAALPELDYLVGDIYKPGGNIVNWVLETFQKNGAYGKPTFSTEFGGYWNGTTPARLEADLHAGLWSTYMTQSAAAPFFWWFDFVDRNDLYSHFAAFAAFSKGDDRRGPATTEEPMVTHSGARKTRALALRRTTPVPPGGTSAWLWVYDEYAMEVLPEEQYAPLISKAQLRLDLPDGRYKVEFWDTYRGRVVRSFMVDAIAGLRINVPDFKRDIAAKVRLVRPADNKPGRAVHEAPVPADTAADPDERQRRTP
jgi:hypothetical protein